MVPPILPRTFNTLSCITGLLFVIVRLQSQSSPSYEGKSLEQWLQIWEKSSGRTEHIIQEKAAEEAIRKMDGDAAVYMAKLIENWDPRLNDNRFFRSVNHAFSVLRNEGREAVPILLQSLHNFGENLPESRNRFRFTLANLSFVVSEAEAAKALLHSSKFENGAYETHYIAIPLSETLKKGHQEVREIIHKALLEPQPTRTLAALALAISGEYSPKVLEVLSASLRESVPVLHTHILVTISTMNDPNLAALVEPLSHFLSSDDKFTRGLAAKTLGRIGKEGLPAILQACQSKTSTMRSGGAQALAIYCQESNLSEKSKSSAQSIYQIQTILRELLQTEDRSLVLMALSAVKELGSLAKDLHPEVALLKSSEDSSIAENARKALDAIRDIKK